MEAAEIAQIISAELASQTSKWVAIIGLIGVVVGAVIAVAGNIVLHWLQDRPRRELDDARKVVLRSMLNDPRFEERWRTLSTMARVIGANLETTKRLLVELGARGSERDDDLWGLIKHHPLEEIEKQRLGQLRNRFIFVDWYPESNQHLPLQHNEVIGNVQPQNALGPGPASSAVQTATARRSLLSLAANPHAGEV